MPVYRKEIKLSTQGREDMTDLTAQVKQIAAASGIKEGIVHIFNVGSTAALGAIEFEPGLCADLPRLLGRLIPPSRSYAHETAWQDGNGHSHLQATLLGPEITVPLARGELRLGTWQQIFHYEADIKPRQRSVVVTVLGEK